MADNELDLMQWQIGTQSAFDTAVTPTAKLIGVTEGEIAAQVETSPVAEQRATLSAAAFAATVDKKHGEASLTVDLTYEQAAYWLDSALGTATPGTGPGYARTYAAPLGTKPTPRILTLTRGSALDARCLKGAIVNELTLKAESNARATAELAFLGHSVESDSLAALSDTTPDYMHANQLALTFDTWAGTMGATPLVPLAYSLELGLNLNRMLQHGIGSLNPVGHKIKRGEGDSNQLKLTLELDSTSAGYYNSIVAATTEVFKAQIQGTFTLGSKIFVFQYAGYCPEAPAYVADSDGIATLEFIFSPMYHATFGNWFKASLTNLVSTMP